MSLPIAIVASGNGTNAQAMIDLMHKGVLDVDIRLIFCNRPNARVIERAKAAGIPWQMEDHKLYPTREAFDAVMIDALKKSGAELIVLAGYMRLLTKSFLDAFKNRVVNIHPSLLPKFGGKGMYGDRVHQAVLAAGETESGITIHYTNEQYDEGAIIRQYACPVLPDDTPDTLAARVHTLEYAHYPEVIEALVQALP